MDTSAHTSEPSGQVRRRAGLLLRRVSRALRGQRLRPIWIMAIFAYGLFLAFRLGLLILALVLYPEVSWQNISGHDLLWCFVLGFGFDSMAVGYLLLPMGIVLAGCAAGHIRNVRLRRWITIYAAVASIYMLALEVVGAAFFLQYGSRIDWRLPYYTQHAHEVWGFLFYEYYIWAWLLLVPLLFYGFYRLYRAWFWRGHVTSLAGWRRAAFVAGVLAVFVLACRGGFERRPLNSSKAYYTANKVLAQLAMNNNYTLYDGTRNMLDEEAENEKGRFDLMEADEAGPVARSLLWQQNDEPVPGAANPLWRRTVTGQPLQRPNVVFVVMESMAGRHVGALGHPHSQTPHLDALSREGLFFSRLYAVGPQTSRGLVGTFCGYPDLSGQTILAREQAQGNFLTLPQIFRQRGYRTAFLSCGKPSFDSMDVFFAAGGVETIIGQENIAVPPQTTWGVPDEYVYDEAIKLFNQYEGEGETPFFGIVLTISNHEPYDVPRGRVAMLEGDDEETLIINATRYADWALGKFFRDAAAQPWFEDTVFVLVADTGRQAEYDRTRLIDATGFRIPCIIYAPGRENVTFTPQTIETVGSQTDIAPTLLAMLGGDFEHCFLGRNLLAVEPGEGFALLHQYDQLGLMRRNRLIVLPPRQQPPILYQLFGESMHRLPPTHPAYQDAHAMKQQLLSLYSMAWLLYKEGLYCSPQQVLALDAGR